MRGTPMQDRATPSLSTSPPGAAGGDAFAERLAEGSPRFRAFLGTLQRGGATHGATLDDLVQETLARAWRSRDTFDERRGTFEAWTLRIAFAVYLDHRASPPPVAAIAEPVGLHPGPVERAAAREHLVQLLGRLGERERHLLLRFHRDGRSIAELAAETGQAPGTIKSVLHRARARLWQFERQEEER